jgi:hypothetical protein
VTHRFTIHFHRHLTAGYPTKSTCPVIAIRPF